MTYTRAEIVNGTGWEKGARFVLAEERDALLEAVLDLIPWAEGTHNGTLECDCDRCQAVTLARAVADASKKSSAVKPTEAVIERVEFVILVMKPGQRRGNLLASDGKVTRLRVHALRFPTLTRAEEVRSQLEELNPGVRAVVKVA